MTGGARRRLRSPFDLLDMGLNRILRWARTTPSRRATSTTKFCAHGLFLVLTVGCATPPPTVEIPIAISCLPQAVPARPAVSSNADLKALDDEGLVLTIAAERLSLIGYSAQAEAVIQACK